MDILTRRNIPNLITVLRLILLAPTLYCLMMTHYGCAFALFLIAGFSDGLDGFLARRYNWKSRFGAIADPTADKLLIVLTFFGLSWAGQIPWWLTGIILLRDLIIVVGAYIYFHVLGPFKVTPSMISKVNTVVQLIFLVIILFNAAIAPVSEWFLNFSVTVVTLACICSGMDYIIVWLRRGLSERRRRRESN